MKFSISLRQKSEDGEAIHFPYSTPEQTAGESYQTIPSRILQEGFRRVRSYDKTRDPTEQHKQRIYSEVTSK